jgi:hypothetical protein
LHGTAADGQGEPIVGVSVTLTGQDAARKTTTDARGDFRFLGLSPGVYSVELERDGFRDERHEAVVQVGRNAVLDVAMELAGAREEVTVLPPSMDARKVETGAAYDERLLRDLPTTRDQSGILRQVPGVLLADMNVGRYRGARFVPFVGKGSHEDQNTFHLDGTGVSIGGFSPNTYDFDSLDSVTVITGGSDPALATPGVTLSLVTKHGTNQLAGSARALYTDDSQWDYGAQVGGPLWKDHIWLWGAGSSTSFLGQTFFLFDGEPVRSRETSLNWNAKLTAQLVPTNAFTLGYTRYERRVDGRDAGPNRSAPTTLDVTFPGYSLRVEDAHVFSENLFATISYSYVPNYRDALPKGGLSTQANLDANEVWRGSYAHSFIRRDQHQYGLTATGFFATGAVRHELKFGFGYRHAFNESASSWPADQLVGQASFDPAQASVTREQNAKFLDDFYDAYLSDTLRAGDWTVNFGVRFDDQRSRNLPSSVPANPVFPDLLPSVQYAGDHEPSISWRSASPRIGVTRAMGADRRTLVRASYARYASQVGTEVVHVNAFPGIASRDYAWTDSNGDGRVQPGEIDLSAPLGGAYVNPDDPGSSASVNRIAAGLKPPLTDEVILGVDRQILADLSVSAAYTHRRLREPLFAPLIGTTRESYRFLGNASGTVVDPTTGFALDFSEPYYRLTIDPPPDGTLLENRPDAVEIYDGFELQLEKSFSNGWSLRASFAYNDWRQRIGPEGIVDPNNVVPGVNADGPIVAGNINATWQLNVAGVVVLPFAIQAGVNLFGRQGFPILYAVEAATLDSLDSRPLLQIGSAADHRTPDVFQLDVQLSRDVDLGPRVTLSPTVTCFNLLGSETVLARDGLVGWYDATTAPAFEPSKGFNRIQSTLGPRTIRGGVRISF